MYYNKDEVVRSPEDLFIRPGRHSHPHSRTRPHTLHRKNRFLIENLLKTTLTSHYLSTEPHRGVALGGSSASGRELFWGSTQGVARKEDRWQPDAGTRRGLWGSASRSVPRRPEGVARYAPSAVPTGPCQWVRTPRTPCPAGRTHRTTGRPDYVGRVPETCPVPPRWHCGSASRVSRCQTDRVSGGP